MTFVLVTYFVPIASTQRNVGSKMFGRSCFLQVIHSSSKGHAHSSGIASAILVSLLACVLAALGYYLFRHKMDAFHFHYFKNEDEDAAAGGPTKPSLISILNPLYSGSRAFTEPFGETSSAAEPAEPKEPPNILDLDQ
ncbi:hypothetical protein CHARACLAT_031955 [Characodon lateralis]|uniref:Uncharacterized protein n=1 Tax=Characodon lateralis TaxID=208331 RepID=A0ABU7EQE3_9TELE|nr:hypothetical protein [Characodon lateralis]